MRMTFGQEISKAALSATPSGAVLPPSSVATRLRAEMIHSSFPIGSVFLCFALIEHDG